jgi:hypothetical protein
MKEKPYIDHKASLTPAEKLRVAVAVLVDGFDQHKVANLMGVNPGRVNEAVVAVRQAIEREHIVIPDAAAGRPPMSATPAPVGEAPHAASTGALGAGE